MIKSFPRRLTIPALVFLAIIGRFYTWNKEVYNPDETGYASIVAYQIANDLSFYEVFYLDRFAAVGLNELVFRIFGVYNFTALRVVGTVWLSLGVIPVFLLAETLFGRRATGIGFTPDPRWMWSYRLDGQRKGINRQNRRGVCELR